MRLHDIMVWFSTVALFALAYHINPTIQNIPSLLLTALGTGIIIIYYSIKEFEKLANDAGRIIKKIYTETTEFIEHITDLILDTVRKTLADELGTEKANDIMNKIYDRLTTIVQTKITEIIQEIKNNDENKEKENNEHSSKMFI